MPISELRTFLWYPAVKGEVIERHVAMQGALAEGRDALLCLYGVSNAGKTYTMFGTEEVCMQWLVEAREPHCIYRLNV